MTQRTGGKRTKITIQETTQGHDSMGGPTDTWTALANWSNIWAERKDKEGREAFTGDREQALRSAVWQVKYRGGGITEQMRVLEVRTGQTFDIVSVMNPDQRKVNYEILGVRVAA